MASAHAVRSSVEISWRMPTRIGSHAATASLNAGESVSIPAASSPACVSPTLCEKSGHSLGEWCGMIAAGILQEEDVDALLGTLTPGTLEASVSTTRRWDRAMTWCC